MRIMAFSPALRLVACLLIAVLALGPRAVAQSLPDLGGPGDVALSPTTERKLGETIVREIRSRTRSR